MALCGATLVFLASLSVIQSWPRGMLMSTPLKPSLVCLQDQMFRQIPMGFSLYPLCNRHGDDSTPATQSRKVPNILPSIGRGGSTSSHIQVDGQVRDCQLILELALN